MELQTPKEGAQTSIHLAVAYEVAAVTGQYFSDCNVVVFLNCSVFAVEFTDSFIHLDDRGVGSCDQRRPRQETVGNQRSSREIDSRRTPFLTRLIRLVQIQSLSLLARGNRDSFVFNDGPFACVWACCRLAK